MPSGATRIVVFIGAGVVVAIAIYAVAMRIALPLAIERALTRYSDTDGTRSATLEDASFNPFTLTATLTNLRARDDVAGLSLAAPRVSLNLGWLALVSGRVILDRAAIEQPTLEIAAQAIGGHLEALLSDAEIERLELRDGRLDIVAGADAGERRLTLRAISLSATDLDGRPAAAAAPGGRFTLTAADTAGAEIDVDGTLVTGLAAVSGLFTLNGLDLEHWRPWLGPHAARMTPRGTLTLAGQYRIEAPLTRAALEINEARAMLEDLSVAVAPDLHVGAAALVATTSAAIDAAMTARMQLELAGAGLVLEDSRTPRAVPLVLDDVMGSVGLDAAPSSAVTLALEGRLGDGGPATIRAHLPTARDAERTLAITLDDVPAELLRPVVAATLGRELRAGQGDVTLDFVDVQSRVSGTLEIVARGLTLGPPAAAASTQDDARLDLAVALLEDPQGRLELEVPFTVRSSATDLRSALSTALRARITGIAAAPFTTLGTLVERDRSALRAVPFAPGDAGLGAAAQETLDALAAALAVRPRLGVRVLGGYDGRADRDALARQQIELHVLLASSDPSPSRRPEPVDFASPRAQDVLDEFAGERLPPAQLTSLAARHRCTDDSDVVCRAAYYAAVFDALVANETIATGTLSRLGRFRAQSIVDALGMRGIAAERVSVDSGTPLRLDDAVGLAVEVYAIAFDAQP